MTFPRAFKHLEPPARVDERVLRAALRELAAAPPRPRRNRPSRTARDRAGEVVDLGEGVIVDVRDRATGRDWSRSSS